LTLATLDLGGNAGTGGLFTAVEDDRNHPNGPRRGGTIGATLIGGVETPEEAEDTDSVFFRGGRGGRAPIDVASVTSLDSRVLSVSSRDTSVRLSAASPDILC